MFDWFEPVLYLDPVSKFPEITEMPGYFVGFSDNVGDSLTFKILKNDLVTVLHRIVVRSAADSSHRNRRVSYKSDVQESLKLLDTKPNFVCKDCHHKHKSRNTNHEVSNRTRSKADYTDQHIGSRTRSKIHNLNINNLSVQNLFFPLYDAILYQAYGKSLHYVERTIAIYDLFRSISRIGSCMSSRYVTRFKYLNHFLVCQSGMLHNSNI
jgi:hypothetical protein